MELSRKELEKINNYRILSYVNYYVYNDNIKEIIELCESYPYDTCILFNDKFLSMLENFVLLNKEYKMINDRARSNIFDMLFYIRQNKKYDNFEERESYIDRYNDIIRNLNRTKEKSDYRLYMQSELSARMLNPESLLRENIELNEDLFIESYGYDISILEALSESDDEFNSFAEDMIGDEYYFASIIKFAKEIPELFKDDKMYPRIKYIFDLNKREIGLYFSSPATIYRNTKTLSLVKKIKNKK